VIDIALLGLLSEQSLHGYELKKRLEQLLQPGAAVSFGSVYPALARLERQGAVAAAEADERVATIPMTGSLAGELAAFRARSRREVGRARGRRGRKVYRITRDGAQRLRELLADPAGATGDDRDFALRVALCGLLPRSRRIELFERRLRELQRRLDESPRPIPDHEPDPYRRALRERDAEALAADISWLERLLEHERTEHARSTPTGGTNP
jgi:DNA-binding PadR family transcriptional regulator